METCEQWMMRIGSRTALDERVALRLAGKINQPIKGTHGTEVLVAILGEIVTPMPVGMSRNFFMFHLLQNGAFYCVIVSMICVMISTPAQRAPDGRGQQ